MGQCTTRALTETMSYWLLVLLLSLSPGQAATRDSEGFRWAEAGYSFEFPRDHGSHPEFKIEWWYLTGHLWNTDRTRRFGYQATFFRRGIQPNSETSPENDAVAFGSSQIYFCLLYTSPSPRD